MKKINFYILSLLLSFCNLLKAELPHVEEGLRLIAEESQCLNIERHMNIFGWGGSMLESINTLELTVEVPAKLNLNDSRTVFYITLLDWMDKVNSDEKAKPFFKNSPMTLENFSFRMMLADFNTLSTKEDPRIAFIFNKGDKIIYCYMDRQTKMLEPFLRESSSDGIEILKKQQLNSNQIESEIKAKATL